MCGDILKFSPNLELLHQHHVEVIVAQFQFFPYWQRNAVLSIQLSFLSYLCLPVHAVAALPPQYGPS